MIALVFISFGIFLVYNIVSIILFGIPKSLSDTYYEFEMIHKNLGNLFTLMMVLISGTLVPAWIDLSSGSNFQFISFLAAAMILLVGVAPRFKGVDDVWHSVFAISAAVFAILWQLIFTKFGIASILASSALIVTLGLVTKTMKKCKTYWLEMIAFISTYASIIIQYYL